jgi:hypothetical protein
MQLEKAGTGNTKIWTEGVSDSGYSDILGTYRRCQWQLEGHAEGANWWCVGGWGMRECSESVDVCQKKCPVL